MPSQASFSGEPVALKSKPLEAFLDELYDKLENKVPEGNIPRIERNFGRQDVFVQTNDYNLFAKDGKITFHGLERDMAAYLKGEDYEWEDEESGEILELLADEYSIEEPLAEIKWY